MLDVLGIYNLLVEEPDLETAIKTLVEMCGDWSSPEAQFLVKISIDGTRSMDAEKVCLGRLAMMAVWMAKQNASVSLN